MVMTYEEAKTAALAADAAYAKALAAWAAKAAAYDAAFDAYAAAKAKKMTAAQKAAYDAAVAAEDTLDAAAEAKLEADLVKYYAAESQPKGIILGEPSDECSYCDCTCGDCSC